MSRIWRTPVTIASSAMAVRGDVLVTHRTRGLGRTSPVDLHRYWNGVRVDGRTCKPGVSLTDPELGSGFAV